MRSMPGTAISKSAAVAGALVALSFGLGRALLVGQLRIADSFCQHLAQLGFCLRRFARVEFLKLSHEQNMGMPEEELNPQRRCNFPRNAALLRLR